MRSSPLLQRPRKPSNDGRIHRITPASAGWTHVGFEVWRLEDGASLARRTGEREVCLVLVSGKVEARADGRDFGLIGGRASPFDGPADSLYAPAQSNWRVTARGPVEIAACSAPGKGGRFPARVSAATVVGLETRGKGTNVRHVRNILPETAEAESLLVVEVITPGGHWSSYPPHKHDRNRPPHETQLEETYYHRFRPAQGYGVQRVYTQDRRLDETMTISDGDVVLVPRGYHPVGAAHGYDLYYLNVMAGPRRMWRFHNDPAHEWLTKA